MKVKGCEGLEQDEHGGDRKNVTPLSRMGKYLLTAQLELERSQKAVSS